MESNQRSDNDVPLDCRSIDFGPSIKLKGELSIRDVREGLRLQESNKRRVLRFIFVPLTFAFSVFLGWIGASSYYFDTSAAVRILAVALLFLLAAIATLFFERYVLWRSWKRKVGFFDNKRDVKLSANGFDVTATGTRQHWDWSFFFAHRRAENVVLLYNAYGWSLIGRSRFPGDEEWNRFSKFVETTLPVYRGQVPPISGTTPDIPQSQTTKSSNDTSTDTSTHPR